MIPTYRTCKVLLILFTALTFMLVSPWAHAEITTDGTMGSNVAFDGMNDTYTISAGQQIGGNLFHSFGIFNVNTGETATFSGDPSVANIISRVTGGTASSIDGLLKSTISGANLFLLNPAGVVFGPNASLEISGSFHVSTADYLSLGEDGRFDATQPANDVLTASPPSAFGFLGDNPSSIFIEGQLQVPDGKTLSVVGGDITMTSGYLAALGGRINVAGVASSGEVVPTASDLNTDSFSQLGNVRLA